MPAQQRSGKRWFEGSADAIFQNLNIIQDEQPDVICVFGADHIYRMDAEAMVDAHLASGAGATVAGIRVPVDQASQFGVIEAGPDGRDHRLPREARAGRRAARRPRAWSSPRWATTSSRPRRWSTRSRVTPTPQDSAHDMGGNIIVDAVARGEAAVYDYSQGDVPGSTDRDRNYWRDVGTIDAYYDAHMDLISVDPIFNLYNDQWPIYTWLDPLPPAKFVFDDEGRRGQRGVVDGLGRGDRLRRHGAHARCCRRACGSTATPRSRTRC